MLNGFFNLTDKLFPQLAFSASRRWFDFISGRDSGRHMLFMNYGYDAETPVQLEPQDEPDRYSIQLYHQVAAAVDLKDLDVLEVGSGRGGGASYVMRNLGPASMTGIDLSANAITFCRSQYDIPGLRFEQDDAEALSFADNSFDALLNIESSICYEKPEKFFAEARRVLKPGGHFLYADLRDTEALPGWERQIAESGFEPVEIEDITPRVVSALDQDTARRGDLIDRYVPWGLRKIFREFAGLSGSKMFYTALQRGEKIYRRYLLRKPGLAENKNGAGR